MAIEQIRQLRYDHPYRYDQRLFGGNQLWSPSNMTTVVWHDAYDLSTITESAGAVSQWDDKSGNNNHLAQVTGAEQPQIFADDINQLDCIDFNQVDSENMDWTTGFSYLDKQFFAVLFQTDITRDRQCVFSSVTDGSRLSIAQTTGYLEYASTVPSYPSGTAGTIAVVDNVPAILWWQTGAGSNTLQFGVNGTIEDSTETDNGTGETTIDQVAKRGTNTDKLDGRIGEIIVTGILTEAERQKVEGYLAHKWNLQSDLPVSHPYKTEPPYVEFSPDDITATQAWYDADDADTITESAGKVSQWDDKIGTKHMTQATGARQPSYEASHAMAGNQPAIYSTSTSGRVGLDMPTSRVTAKHAYLVSYYKTGVETVFGNFPILLQSYNAGSGATRVIGNGSGDNWVLSSQFNDRSYRDGSLTDSTTALPMPLAIWRFESDDAYEGFNILSDNSEITRDYYGGISELILTDGTESTGDKLKIEGYLAHKWGLTSALPSDHPYKTNAPLK